MAIATVNPATNETLREFTPHTDQEIEDKLALAAQAFRIHRRTPFAERSACMLDAARLLEAEQEKFASLMTIEMGKPLQAARDEATKCASACRYYAEHAESFLKDETVETKAARSFVRYQPLGAVLAVMPWNFPFWQVFRFAAPTLMAGNVALLKHASNVPQCALAIEEIFQRAGFTKGAFQTLLISSNRVEKLIDDPRIAAATLTGSEPAGSSVASSCGRRIKKTVLELGGSDPFIVMPSADLDAAIESAVKARTINNGQSCIAAKRFIVAEQIYSEFEHRFTEAMKHLVLGDPMNQATQIGPLATPDILADLHQQVEQTIAAGATLLTGGQRVDRPGNFYLPTVLTNIPPHSPGYTEEFFGPVALLFPVCDAADAVRVANDTSFGLGSSAWTNDERERDFFVEELEAGQVFINAVVASDPRLPFGGIKRSGFGRELGAFGIREFVNIKTIWIDEQKKVIESRDTE